MDRKINPPTRKSTSPEPRSILLSKRANAFYLEHARVMQKDGRLLFLTQRGEDLEQFFNIPHKNTSFLLLGTGTSITSSASRLLAESGVMVGFVGSGGSPLLAAVDPVFMTPLSEYRPTAYMQAWMKIWLDETKRIAAAKHFMQTRIEWVRSAWSKNRELSNRKVDITDSDVSSFARSIDRATTTEDLLSAEAIWSRQLYAKLRDAFFVDQFVRTPRADKKQWDRPTGSSQKKATATNASDVVNSFLNHGNYIAYGYAAVAIYALGISFALPVLHGKTRRGALVFDVADLFKDAIVMPLAFEMGSQGAKDQAFRNELIDQCLKIEVIDEMIDSFKKCIDEIQ